MTQKYRLEALPVRNRTRFASWAEMLSRTLSSDSFLGYRGSGIALLLSLTVVATILCVTGAAPIAGPWDMAALLDGGWRILNGGAPHTDFHNPIGPLAYLLVAFGMKLTTQSTSAIAYGTFLSLVLVAPMAWYIASRRLAWAIAFAFVLFIGLLLITPRPLGYDIRETTYAMIYNRQSYVLLSLLLLCVFLKPRNIAKNSDAIDGVLAGVLLGLILYCKITYFIAASALLLFATVTNRQPPRWFLICALCFLGVVAGFYLVFDISLYSYARDVAQAGRSQSSAMRLQLLFKTVFSNATWIYILILSLGVWTWAESQPEKLQSPILVWAIVASIIAAGLLISSGNAAQSGGRDDPLYFVAAVIALELFRRRNDREVTQCSTSVCIAHTASLLLLLPIFGGTILARDFASSAYAVVWNLENHQIAETSQRLNSSSLQDFHVPSSTLHVTAYWLARDYPARINDGIALLEANLRQGDRVTTIAFGNPFSFALHLTPARDYFLWWDLDISFDQRHFPAAEEYLGDASIVMVPRLDDRAKGCCFETVDVLLQLYGDYLRANFWKQASNDTWILYRRN